MSFLLKLFFGQAKKSLRKFKSVLFFLDKKKKQKNVFKELFALKKIYIKDKKMY